MKVLKTIVATAAIVFALTTAAVAGVQHYGGGGETGAQLAQAAAPVQAQPAAAGSVTLSAQQFTALLRAVRHDGHGTHDRQTTRTHAKARAHSHARQQTHSHATSGEGSGGATTSPYTSTHDTGTHDGTHDGGGHDGGHDGGGHDGGGHDGGCD